MKTVAVLPFIVPHFKDVCLSNCKIDNVLVVDNTERNRGVMRSHNLGIDFMRREDADWLLVLSAAVRFAPDTGGRDFTEALATTHAEAHVVNAVGVYGWHMIAFRRDVIDAVGRWDENYHPYGFDDNDLSIRIHKAMPDAKWWGVTVGVSDTIMGHSIKVGGVDAPATPLLEYFKGKWGDVPGPPFDAYHDTPWGDPRHDVGYWPAPKHPDLAGGAWDEPAPEPIPDTIFMGSE